MDAAQVVVVAGIVLAVVAFVVWPMVSKRPRTSGAGAGPVDDARIEARIGEYRAALRRRTVCARCLFPNVEGARFCAECGSPLAGDGSAASTG